LKVETLENWSLRFNNELTLPEYASTIKSDFPVLEKVPRVRASSSVR